MMQHVITYLVYINLPIDYLAKFKKEYGWTKNMAYIRISQILSQTKMYG